MLWTLERNLLYACNATARWFPRVSLNMLLIWALYTIVVNLSNLVPILTVILGFPSLVFLALAIVSYNQVWYFGPGAPQDIPELHTSDESIPLCLKYGVMAKREGGYRYCQKCKLWKPDRAHHCSSCRSCRLRMDHHCPWFSCCIGFNNHKPFVQFLWYSAFVCCYGLTISCLIIFNWFGTKQFESQYIDVNLLMFAIISAVFALITIGFGAYTTWLAANNTTTIEALEKGATTWRTSLPSTHYRYREAPTMSSLGNLWDLGSVTNLNQILGRSWIEWLLPIPSRHPTDFIGVLWPINQDLFDEAEERAQTEIGLLQQR